MFNRPAHRVACCRLLPLVIGAELALAPSSAPGQVEATAVSPADSAVPGSQRLFFAPTGRTLPAGVSEAGTYLLVAPYVGHAFHDRFMIAAGTPLITESLGRFWYIAPKISLLAADRWHVAGGALLIVEAGVNPLSRSGGRPNVAKSFVWGVVTFGGPRAAVTLGATTDMGQLAALPDGGATIVGGEYELLAADAEANKPSFRLIAEGYWPWLLSGKSPSDISLNVVGFRVRAGRVAFEVTEGFEIHGGQVNSFTRFPLFHVSFLF